MRWLLTDGGARSGVEMKDKYGRTPLASAASAEQLAVVRLLAEQGADVDTENKQGATPLLVASQATVSFCALRAPRHQVARVPPQTSLVPPQPSGAPSSHDTQPEYGSPQPPPPPRALGSQAAAAAIATS